MGAEVIAYFPVPAEQLAGANEHLELVAPLQAGAATLTAKLTPRSAARTGERIRLAVDVARLHFFDGETEQAIW